MQFFRKKVLKSFGSSEKSSTFATANEKQTISLLKTLGYGVMVTLQILVLSFLVRIRVSQRHEASFTYGRCFFIAHYLRERNEKSPFKPWLFIERGLEGISVCVTQ